MNNSSNTKLHEKVRAKRVEGVAPTAYAGGGGDVSPINGEAPPETCPICKSKKERFEQFI